MKSAYELAMEKLKSEAPDDVVALSDEQRDALAEIDKRFKAKTAEREIFLTKLLSEVLAKGNSEEAELIGRQLSDEKTRLNEEMDAAKEKVRKGE